MEVRIFVGCLEVLKHSQMALPQENPLIWEPPLQHMIFIFFLCQCTLLFPYSFCRVYPSPSLAFQQSL
jgi:hypothetical protein